MITEDYVSFETAKLLKEKGFDEPTLYYYIAGHLLQHYSLLSNGDTAGTSAPTLQMTMKWLREVHKIFITILFIEDTNYFAYTIENLNTKKYLSTSKDISYNNYEEAVEAAIKYCLENLIWITIDSKDSRCRTCATKLCCFCSYNKRNNYGNNQIIQ